MVDNLYKNNSENRCSINYARRTVSCELWAIVIEQHTILQHTQTRMSF